MHQQFMEAAIALAEEKLPVGDGGPFAALIVKGGQIIGRGWNRVVANNDPTAHAEVEAIRDACRAEANFNLAGCILYVNCEPCPMCLAAAYWAGITEIFYAATREDAAAIGFADADIYKELSRPLAERSMVMQQLLRSQALPTLCRWESTPEKIRY